MVEKLPLNAKAASVALLLLLVTTNDLPDFDLPTNAAAELVELRQYIAELLVSW